MRMVILKRLPVASSCSSLVVLLRVADDPPLLGWKVEPYAIPVAERHHEVGICMQVAFRQLYGLTTALGRIPESLSVCLLRQVEVHASALVPTRYPNVELFGAPTMSGSFST